MICLTYLTCFEFLTSHVFGQFWCDISPILALHHVTLLSVFGPVVDLCCKVLPQSKWRQLDGQNIANILRHKRSREPRTERKLTLALVVDPKQPGRLNHSWPCLDLTITRPGSRTNCAETCQHQGLSLYNGTLFGHSVRFFGLFCNLV